LSNGGLFGAAINRRSINPFQTGPAGRRYLVDPWQFDPAQRPAVWSSYDVPKRSMEGIMIGPRAEKTRFPTVEFMVDAVAEWFKRHRSVHESRNDFGQCDPAEVSKIAKDLGLPANDLRGLSAKGSGAANAMSQMLRALLMDPVALAESDPATMRDLQRTCILCGEKGRCRYELADGTAAQHYREFCPNAYTLDALLKQSEQPRRH